jgi:hypothetical protein
MIRIARYPFGLRFHSTSYITGVNRIAHVAFLSRISHTFLAALPGLGMLPNLAAPGVIERHVYSFSINPLFRASKAHCPIGPRPQGASIVGLSNEAEHSTRNKQCECQASGHYYGHACANRTRRSAWLQLATAGHFWPYLAEHCKRCKHC